MKNKFAIVTGASTGIGREVAVKLGGEGLTVGLIARSREKLERTKDLVKKAGGKGVVFESNLSNVDDTNSLIGSIKKTFPKIDVIANVAGIWHGEGEIYAGVDFDKFDQKIILDTLSVGIVAPMLLIHGLASLMPKGSNIINISGTFESGAKGWLPYYVSKRGIEDLTVGLSEELKDREIYVNCVSPSDTATEEYVKYFPEYAKDGNSPEVIAEVVWNLIKSKQTSQFVVVKEGKVIKNSFHK